MVYYSYDIFDTLITRKTASPLGIFLLMEKSLSGQKEQFPISLITEFHKHRIEAEHVARLLPGREEITIGDIYEELAKKFNLSQEQRNNLLSLELSTEFENCAPIPENIKKFNALPINQRILISDMYLDIDTLVKMLDKAGVKFKNEFLFVSSMHNCTKFTGKLYSLVLKSLSISAKSISHFGDNKVSDYYVPSKLGIKATCVQCGHLTTVERTLFYEENNLHLQVIVGAIRSLRLQNNNALYTTVLSLGAVPYFFYTKWCLQTANKLNLKTLHFVSRDGYLLSIIAKKIEQQLSIKCCNISYLYISRYASYLASLTLPLTTDKLMPFFSLSEKETVQTVLGKLGIEKEIASFAHFNNRVVSLQDLKKIINIVLMTPHLLTLVENYFTEQNHIAKLYLKGAGIFDSHDGIVDIGWKGTTYQSLLHATENDNLHAFYFGFKSHNYELNSNKIWVYYSNFYDQTAMNGSLYEFLLPADHNSVIGYENEGNIITPKLKLSKKSELDNTYFRTVLKAYTDFTKEYLSVFDNLNDEFSASKIVDLLNCYTSKPDYGIVKPLLGLSFSGGVGDIQDQQFVRKLNLLDLIAFHLKVSKQIYWFEGAIVNSTKFIKVVENIINRIICIKNLCRQCIQLVSRRIGKI